MERIGRGVVNILSSVKEFPFLDNILWRKGEVLCQKRFIVYCFLGIYIEIPKEA